ncbi:TPA: PIN-like domain-containing protein [Stenotrophomonas maltophilia]|uniref:PIN-like domain-containing protein n=1 Tax=Stenotrophomonas maltophilia TaxID=40324 RepID=UPI0013DB5918|nr:PIN-like domain-containing protein [Stenotrophomonas maltophilia]HDS1677014.1 DUF4935 domain-containing protein [Stenotrophomonas maltophilia]
MKTQFAGYFDPTEDEIADLWKYAVIALDTNVLLGLYRMPAGSRAEIFEMLKGLATRLWVPYHVLVEFHRNRLEVLRQEYESSQQLAKDVQRAYQTFRAAVKSEGNKERACWPQLEEKLDAIGQTAKELIKVAQTESEHYIAPNKKDAVLAFVEALLEGQFGSRPSSQSVIDVAEAEAAERYAVKMGPGYLDTDKAGDIYMFDGLKYDRQYGDYMVWKELLKFASQPHIRHILLITSDIKPDWWLDSRSISGKRPQPELSMEMRRVGGVTGFWMYTLSDFIKNAKVRLDAKITSKTISDVIHSESSSAKNVFASRTYQGADLEAALSIVSHKQLDVDDLLASGFSTDAHGEDTPKIVVAATSALVSKERLANAIQEAIGTFNLFLKYRRIDVIVLTRAIGIGPGVKSRSQALPIVADMVKGILPPELHWSVTLASFKSARTALSYHGRISSSAF